MKRTKKCPYCKEQFTPYNSFQKHCLEHSECIEQGNESKKKRKKRKAIKELQQIDVKHLTKVAQYAFNKYIRARDGNKCITCGATNRQIHAGHYRPVGRNHLLRFNEMNCHSQCSICNNHLSGNLVPYRKILIDMYGEEMVDELESSNDPYSYDIDELKQIIARYKQKYKDIT